MNSPPGPRPPFQTSLEMHSLWITSAFELRTGLLHTSARTQFHCFMPFLISRCLLATSTAASTRHEIWKQQATQGAIFYFTTRLFNNMLFDSSHLSANWRGPSADCRDLTPSSCQVQQYGSMVRSGHPVSAMPATPCSAVERAFG